MGQSRILQPSEVGKKIKELLKEKGLKSGTAARKMEIKRDSFTRWESGRTYPKADSLAKVAEFFDVDVEYLLTDTEIRRSSDRAAAETIGISPEAVEIVRSMKPATRRALESLIVAGAVLDPWDEFYQDRVDPPLPARGAAVSERDDFLARLAGALDQRAQIGAQALTVEEDLQAGADVNLRNDLQLLRIRIEKQTAKRAELLRAFSAYIDRIFPEVSEDQRILQEAEAKLRPLPSIGARRDFSEE